MDQMGGGAVAALTYSWRMEVRNLERSDCEGRRLYAERDSAVEGGMVVRICSMTVDGSGSVNLEASRGSLWIAEYDRDCTSMGKDSKISDAMY